MPGIMERISLIARSEISDLRERYEDPEKAINQTIADAMVVYTSLKQELDPMNAAEAQAKGRLDTLVDEAQRWQRVARKAVAAGNDGDARTALSRKHDLGQRIDAQQAIYDQVHEVAEKLRTQVAAIEDGIARMQAQMARIKGRDAAARATSAANDFSDGTSALDRLEEKSEWELAEAEGLAEARRLAANPLEDVDPTHGSDAQIDAELERLRASLADEA